MIDSIYVRASVLARLHRNPLQPHLEQLATTLHEQGYARSSIRDCVLPAISLAGGYNGKAVSAPRSMKRS